MPVLLIFLIKPGLKICRCTALRIIWSPLWYLPTRNILWPILIQNTETISASRLPKWCRMITTWNSFWKTMRPSRILPLRQIVFLPIILTMKMQIWIRSIALTLSLSAAITHLHIPRHWRLPRVPARLITLFLFTAAQVWAKRTWCIPSVILSWSRIRTLKFYMSPPRLSQTKWLSRSEAEMLPQWHACVISTGP